MNKQEEIRKGMQELIFKSWDKPVNKSADLAWDIISYLHSQGVVIKDGSAGVHADGYICYPLEYLIEVHRRDTRPGWFKRL